MDEMDVDGSSGWECVNLNLYYFACMSSEAGKVAEGTNGQKRGSLASESVVSVWYRVGDKRGKGGPPGEP